MKEELLKNLLGVIDYIKQGTDFVVDQAPLYVQEFLQYRLALHTFWIIMSLIGIGLSIWLLIIFIKYCKVETDDYFPCVIPGFIITGFVCSFIANSVYVLKIYFAPRVYLIDSLLRMLNK